MLKKNMNDARDHCIFFTDQQRCDLILIEYNRKSQRERERTSHIKKVCEKSAYEIEKSLFIEQPKIHMDK